MSPTTALINRQATDPVAFITQKIPALNGVTGIIDADAFLSHVKALAAQLPDKSHIINLCGNRYLFLVSVCAAVLREQINLLPPNKNLTTQKRLAERYDNAYVLHDGIEVDSELDQLNFAKIRLDGGQFDLTSDKIPQIHLDQLAIISFTSGSTGDSKPNVKTWRTLTASTVINRQYMLPQLDTTFYILATVPGQHMWGLETSVLMALFTPACVVDSKPLFPLDIQLTLAQLPKPRALVSTPVHLRALVESATSFPETDVVLCATSPLTQDLAQQTEQTFNAQLREVYGCSEVGSMALRTTANETDWLKFTGIHFSSHNGKTIASTEYLPAEIELSDHIDLDENNRFRLLGRSDDMVDIAGKRGSLAEINTVLLKFPGLLDGIVIFPEQSRMVARLVAIVVLKEGSTKEQLKAHFREHLDGVFIPRPIYIVEQLPREENGKLPRRKIEALFAKLSA